MSQDHRDPDLPVKGSQIAIQKLLGKGAQVTLNELSTNVKDVSLEVWGDNYERGASKLIGEKFPSYETFWRVFVFPYRELDSEYLNRDLPRSHEAMCMYNYSAFRSWIRIYRFWMNAGVNKKTVDDVTSETFDDIFIRLAIGYSQIRQLAGTISYVFLCKINGSHVKITKWEDRLQILNDWASVELKNILDSIEENRKKVHDYRNLIIHGAKFPGTNDMIFKHDVAQRLSYWSEFRREYEEKGKSILIERIRVINDCVEGFFTCTEGFWKKAVNDIVDRYGSEQAPNHTLLNATLCNPVERRKIENRRGNFPPTSHLFCKGSAP